MRIIGLDPGTLQSAVVVWDGQRVLDRELMENEALRQWLLDYPDLWPTKLVIEQIESYGMAVGVTTFETVFWSGRFAEAWNPRVWDRMTRGEVKLHWCHTKKAKDTNIRTALLDRFGAPGTRKAPGLLYGLRSHHWAALALAVAWADTHVGEAVA